MQWGTGIVAVVAILIAIHNLEPHTRMNLVHMKPATSTQLAMVLSIIQSH